MTLVAQPEENIAGIPTPILDYMRGKQQTLLNSYDQNQKVVSSKLYGF
jgi:hypothetical protein